MVTQQSIPLSDGRQLDVYDTGPGDEQLTIVWHHGSPQTGRLIEPLLEAAEIRPIRLVSYARPSYGGSTPQPGRTIEDAAYDVESIADTLRLEGFATMGASGGGPPALACAAALGSRVTGVATFASPAPFTRDFDWFAGMASPGGPLSALDGGREGRARYAETDEFDPSQFIAADWAALEGPWRALGRDAGAAGEAGPDGLIDDDVSLVTPWGVDVADIRVPVVVVQGTDDRVIPEAHGRWLAHHLKKGELWIVPGAGHISVLEAVPAAMDWLLANAGAG